MDDQISRQAAIDAANSETVSTNPEHFKSSEMFIKFMDDADIASFGKWQWANGFNTALVATTIKLRKLPSAQPEPKWIPCSERSPEDEKDVLVTRHFLSDNQLKKNAITESFYVEVASRIDDEWTSYSDDYKIKKHLHKVIAWMPLPEPYAERRTNENNNSI